MATNTEVVWASCVKSLLSASYSTFEKKYLSDLVDTIIKSENSILDHGTDNEGFYSAFVALATHYLCTSSETLTKSSLNSVLKACEILLKFLLIRLQRAEPNCSISQKQLVTLVIGLCRGTSTLPKSSVVTFTALLKDGDYPTESKIFQDDEEMHKDLKRPRLDTGRNIFSQLTSVFNEIPSQAKKSVPTETINNDGDTTIVHMSDPSEEMKTTFSNRNIQSLQKLYGGDVLLDVCHDLVDLKRYIVRYQSAIKGDKFQMPLTPKEAHEVRNRIMGDCSQQCLFGDIETVFKIFSLPILEPMTPSRMSKILAVAMSCLFGAVTVSAANCLIAISPSTLVKSATGPKDEEIDQHAVGIVQMSLEIFNRIQHAVKSSTRAGGQVYQNFNMMGAWCLLKGLQYIVSLKKEKDSSIKLTPGKSPQPFGVLAVALATQAITLTSELLEDLHMESLSSMGDYKCGKVEEFFDETKSYSAEERVKKLTHSVNVISLLFGILSVTYRKASSLKKTRPGGDACLDTASCSSESRTYYEDDFSTSDGSDVESNDDSDDDEDDDSEPILGAWFDDPGTNDSLAPPPPPPPAHADSDNSVGSGRKRREVFNGLEVQNFVPDKREPDGYISLATRIVNLMSNHFLKTPNLDLKEYIKTTLTDQHMTQLATVIKDMDKDYPRQEDGHLYEDFSVALARFCHSMISTDLLTEQLQDNLLSNLGVSPMISEAWPLRVYPRTCSVLAEVLLLRQQTERRNLPVKSKSEGDVKNIWTRFLCTLKDSIINFNNNTKEFEDINVEHLQLLMFLFHSLPLLQKKNLLQQIGLSICTVVSKLESPPNRLAEMVPLPLSRLMLIFDYLFHFFYDPPAALMEQVQWNLFGAHVMATHESKDSMTKTHFPCREVEDNYLKSLKSQDVRENVMKPRFYNLSVSEYNNQDLPKSDGLALNFILSNADALSYDDLYDAIISLLMAGSRCDKMEKFTLLDACSVHYNFLICWRLLSCLPPSKRYLQLLEKGTIQFKVPHVLHTLRCRPRLLQNPAYHGWTRECLVKQGLSATNAESLMSQVTKAIEGVKYDVRLATHFIQDQIAIMPLTGANEILPAKELPSLTTAYMLDAVIAKVQVALDDLFTKSMSDTDAHKTMEVATDLLPATYLLIEAYAIYIRSCLLSQLTDTPEEQCSTSPEALKAYGAVLGISSGHASAVTVLGMTVIGWLPVPVRNVVEKWSSSSSNEFPGIGSWRNAFANDIIPVENYIDAILSAHMGTLSSQTGFTPNASYKHVLQALVRFCGDLNTWCPECLSADEVLKVLFPLMFDSTTEYIAENLTQIIEKAKVTPETVSHQTYLHVVAVCHDIIINHSSATSGLDEKVLLECLKFMENSLEKAEAKQAFKEFYTEGRVDLVQLLLAAANDNLSPVHFGTRVLKFFNKLFQLAEKNPVDPNYAALCKSLGGLANLEPAVLQNWLSKMIMGSLSSMEDGGKMQENRHLLQSLTTYIVQENSHVGEKVAKAILNALIPMGSQILSPTSEGIGFSELMVVMATLAGAGTGSGHISLFKAATGWLELCKTYLAQKNVHEKLQENVIKGKHEVMLESTCYLLSYIGDILGAIKHSSEKPGVTSPPYDAEVHIQDMESDWQEEVAVEDTDSAAEDSDEESLNNKLCTYTITQKEFMNQHWYHCHTCKMVDGVGVCTICAKVCHKDHELSYAKYGSFFCDCGAKEDGSCTALVKRTPQSGLDSSGHPPVPSPFSMDTMLTSSLRRRLSSPNVSDKTDGSKTTEKMSKEREALCKQIENSKEALIKHMEQSKTVHIVIDLLQSLIPSIVDIYEKTSPCGSTTRAKEALQQLKDLTKTVSTTEQLMTATLGSQEGAFENVRMNYSGDQGQTIRQLITSHVLRRVAMCCLSSTQGKRQHLAVSHEKGKITILQLSALLKQADSSKRKLTLTRLSSAPVPFTVLSITGNPSNEDYLAVCGLKDCHVLTFNSSGSVSDHLVLHPSLDTGNFIIKALWLPGSQTELAIVTADFVKIYDLSIDAISPQYYFLLPSGKIRDSTFVFTEEGRYMVLMASSGYIYVQAMEEKSSATHGPFYITNILVTNHQEIKENNGQVAGGGVSVYYSHALQLLFFSYSQGKNFCGAIQKDMEKLSKVFAIFFKGSDGGKASYVHPLVQWTEVPNHPGLICSMTQTTNNPVILMIKPDSIQVQEIKVLPAKAKIQDMVAIRHSASSADQRTTLILLCEDGSLRIYMANVDKTNYWMSPTLQPQSTISVLKPVKKKKTTKTGRPVGQVNFPVDFFEHCSQSSDIEFGGNDVLQVYNTAQVKQRLNTTGMYIACTKPNGFTIEAQNSNANHVIVGIRVLVGSQAIERAPSTIEFCGRTTLVNITRSRWFDLPFTREETLKTGKKVSINFGASADRYSVTMVDSLKVYTKTKESFGWPEDTEDFTDSTAPKIVPPSTPGVSSSGESESTVLAPIPLTSVDRLLFSSLEVLEGCFASSSSSDDNESTKATAQEIATQLLTLPTPNSVQHQTKVLLSSLQSGKQAYHTHKDQAQLAHVVQCLGARKDTHQLDPEAYQRLVVTARSVAVARPTNLVKFAEKERAHLEQAMLVTDLEEEEKANAHPASWKQFVQLEGSEGQHFMVQLVDAFWRLHDSRPKNHMIAPVCLPGLTHTEATVGAMIEILHAFTTCDVDNVNLAAKIYIGMLLSEDTVVSFASKQALIRVLRPKHRRRRVFIPSPPRCSTPGAAGGATGGAGGGADDDDDDDQKGDKPQPPPTPQEELPPPQQNGDPESQYEIVEPPEAMVLDPPEPNAAMQPNPLEALLAQAGGGNFPAMLDIPPDADDETMVELAIALSLQDQSSHSGGLGLQGLSLGQQSQGSGSMEAGHFSDTTASAPCSDDEVGSTAATDGSTLRTSPAEHGGSAGSESGGSAVDSVSVSGRSSAYGDAVPESNTMGARSETSSVGMPSGMMQQEGDGSDQADTDLDTVFRLHALRLSLLERMIRYLPHLKDVGGVRSIPFMQVILMLTSDLDSDEEKDKAALDSLLSFLIGELSMQIKDANSMSARSEPHEVKLIIMRLLSVFMSRTKAGTKPSGESSSFISTCTASAMLQCGGLDYCLNILKTLLDYWKALPPEEEGSVLPGQLLKPHPQSPLPDMSPFFLRQYVKGHASDVFEEYPQLMTEMALRLPYQMKKIAENAQAIANPTFEQTWFQILSEYMLTQQTPFVRRQVRKLLLYISGSKEKYRQLRDIHALETHMKDVYSMCSKAGIDNNTGEITPIILPYDVLITLIEHLKACSDIASSRTVNWQKYCQKEDDVLPFLIHTSIALHEGVAPVMLQLLECALCGVKGSHTSGGSSTASPAKSRKDKDKDKNEGDTDEGQKHDEGLCNALVQHVAKCVNRELLSKFIRCFLLESNSTAVRWQAHALVLHIYRSSQLNQQEALLDLMWSLWPDLSTYGRKTAQFVDLLGYFALKTPQTSEKKCKQYVERAVSVLRQQNKILANHPNESIYNMLTGLVEFDGFYMESDPCLVCNDPEVPYSNIKLSQVKVDSKFTTTTQIVKLIGSHNISKVSIKISDLKRTKMVRTINIQYNNRTVQAVVELKNKPGMWHKAKKVTLAAGQTDIKVEFPLPIVACNLMIEYADFYDNFQASAETLQCPRCSASVPANPGVCGNCGENVFQCHKCRSINYDEKDPFLCNACGFCKYAKFDFTLYAKPCCAVDPIENDEDRKKAVTTINGLLEKADRLYKQLQFNKPVLEALLMKITEHGSDRPEEPVPGFNATGTNASNVNKSIQILAQRYCGDCKAAFDELSKIIQKVLASRKELVEYDRQQREAALAAMPISTPSTPTTPIPTPTASPRTSSHVHPLLGRAREVAPCDTKPKARRNQCYGCASATVENCITFLRGLATNTNLRQILCGQGLIKELIDYNLRRGNPVMRSCVRNLLCLLTKDNCRSTDELNHLLMSRLVTSMKGYLSNPGFGASVRHEMMLLGDTIRKEDNCWEQRVRCVVHLFLYSMRIRNPSVTECITLPCLKILKHLMQPDPPTSKKNKDKVTENLSSVKNTALGLHVNAPAWLKADSRSSYQAWKQNMPVKGLDFLLVSKKKKDEKPKDKEIQRLVVRVKFLMEKYGNKWLNKRKKAKTHPLKMVENTWLKQALFCPSCRPVRQKATSILEAFCQTPTRKQEMIDMLTSYLDELGRSGESAGDFLVLYKKLITPGHWRHYLALKGVLPQIGILITKEVDELLLLEETTLKSDLSQGYALKALTELLILFVEKDNIKQHYKSRLVGTVLNGYLSLRKLVIQRTKLIDETQDKLLELLEEMTTGTDSETKEFMAVCVETVEKYPLNDYISPVFIFERLCSIIFPEENDVGDFFMSLEKDPQQEDFLQGRMLGNPYSSNEPGLGPLMRDVKNKICTDCDMVALLEDDTGMELLVNNKIISLDLPVKDVFRKIWVPEHGEGEAMRIVYRMRGLMGDATEDMVNTLDSGKDEDIDCEEVYKMANVMSQCGGLRVMLQRLCAIRDLVSSKQLLTVLLKLFSYCVKVKANRQELIRPEMNTISIMLGALNLALLAEQESGTSVKGQTLTEQVLQIMETILLEASNAPPGKYKEFSKLCGDKDQLMMLLDRINSTFIRANVGVLQALMRLIPFLAFGDEEKMQTLISHFKAYLDFDKFDQEHSQDEQVHLDCFCVIANGIETNANGKKLKDLILEQGIAKNAVDYIQKHAPAIKTLLATDSEDWKEFISKPALPYCLRVATGLSVKHEATQLFIGKELIPILHKLEQASSDEHIGSLAENLMEELRKNEKVAEKVEDIRRQTKAEKKKLAMAMRQKQLGALGMTTNEKGQVTVKSSVLKQMEDLKEETGLTCCICREGYRYQPTKVLGIYTFTKRVNLEDFENKQRKTQGYSTVSHFNIVHVDCHLAAVRHARGREEWDSASLQNANTKCNGLLPLWGPQVPEASFATCLARHNTYLQECTGVRDANYCFTIHDLKHLLFKFVKEKSFSEDSGGGGRQSNIHMVPYMMHMALYVLNTTRAVTREEKNLNNHLTSTPDKWIESAYETEGTLYWCTVALHILNKDKWKEKRITILARLLVAAHVRHVCPNGTTSVPDKAIKDYSVYKPYLAFFCLLDGIFSKVFQKVSCTSDGSWPVTVAEYIRHNDQILLEQSDKLLSLYEGEMLPCESLAEYCDVVGLLEEVPNPDALLREHLDKLP